MTSRYQALKSWDRGVTLRSSSRSFRAATRTGSVSGDASFSAVLCAETPLNRRTWWRRQRISGYRREMAAEGEKRAEMKGSFRATIRLWRWGLWNGRDEVLTWNSVCGGVYSEWWSFLFLHRMISIPWFCQTLMGQSEPLIRNRNLKLAPN